MEGLVGLWISLGVLGGLGLLALIVGAIQRFKEKFDRNFFLTGTAWGLFLGGILIIFSFLQLEGGGLVGLLTFKDGTLMVGGYEGEYKDGKRHGQGTMNYANGNSKKGIWRNDELISNVCKDMGLSPNTEAYGKCILKLMD